MRLVAWLSGFALAVALQYLRFRMSGRSEDLRIGLSELTILFVVWPVSLPISIFYFFKELKTRSLK